MLLDALHWKRSSVRPRPLPPLAARFGVPVSSVRPVAAVDRSVATVALTLPLPGDAYVGSRFADAPWTAPPS